MCRNYTVSTASPRLPPLIVRSNHRAAHPLDTAAMPFCRQLPFSGCPRRTRFEAGLGFFRGLSDESNKAIQGILSIPFLGAEPLGLNDQNAIVVDSSTRQLNQTGTHVVWQIGGIPHIKAKLDCRGDFVYLLAARPGGPNEIESNFVFVNGNGCGNRNHAEGVIVPPPCCNSCKPLFLGLTMVSLIIFFI